MVEEKVQVRCPCKKVHNKKRSDAIVIEEHCSALLGFVDVKNDTSIVFKCRDCKRLVYAEVENGTVFLTKLQDRFKVPVNKYGRVVVNVSQTSA